MKVFKTSIASLRIRLSSAAGRCAFNSTLIVYNNLKPCSCSFYIFRDKVEEQKCYTR